MISLSALLRAAAIASIAPLALACVVQTEPSSTHRGPDPVTNAGGGPVPGASDGSGGTTDSSPSAQPILVDIDTNKTMDVAPGQGVGVFTEYTAGGHWRVTWTCDSLVQVGSTCPFVITASVASGAITNVQGEKLEDKDAVVTADKQIQVTTTTTTDLDGVLFDTDPGAVITLSATLAGKYTPDFFFFVQDGNVNGNYKGRLTDPLMLEGTSP